MPEFTAFQDSRLTIKNSEDLDRDMLAWVIIAQAVTVIPLFLQLIFWLPCVWLLALVWRVQVFRGRWNYPTGTMKFGLGMLCIIGLTLSFGRSVGVNSMVALMVVSFALKLLEIKTKKDVVLILYICIIAIAAQFLFSQTLLAAAYCVVAAVVVFAAWQKVHSYYDIGIKRQFGRSVMLLLQSLPLMLLLFLIVPRISPLWAIPFAKTSTQTGFGDSMAPGDFSNLILSKDTAFRVTFESLHTTSNTEREEDIQNKLPPPGERYWRGLVFDYFDGRRWTRESRRHGPLSNKREVTIQPDSEFYEYSVLLEPHYQRWLFSLMIPTAVDSTIIHPAIMENHLIANRKPVVRRIQYSVRSYRDYLISPDLLSDSERELNTRLPNEFNPKTRQLVKEWRSKVNSDLELANLALDLFRNSFTYTLNPPKLGIDSVDEFLFSTKRGFCEHFSSSFVFMMRAAGIPARVVVGYQGGEYIEEKNYILVRQSDAHAWTEIWVKEKGWIRVDPTSVVSPDRIELGLESALTPEEASFVREGLAQMEWLVSLRRQWDIVNYTWHRRVLGYSGQKQTDFLNKLLGGYDGTRIALLLIGGGGAVIFFAFILLTLSGRKKVRSREADRLFDQLILKLEKKGYVRTPGETPSNFAYRIAQSEPQWGGALNSINELYCLIVYCDQTEHLESLRQNVRRFPRQSLD